MTIELLAQVGGAWNWFGHFALGGLLLLVSLFMILLILVQRGRGGGLAGALGGAGGQSAFGTKAGDTFTKVTSYSAIFWILLCMLTIKVLGSGAPPKVDPDSPNIVIGEEAAEIADEAEAVDAEETVDSADATDAGETVVDAAETDGESAADEDTDGKAAASSAEEE